MYTVDAIYKYTLIIYHCSAGTTISRRPSCYGKYIRSVGYVNFVVDFVATDIYVYIVYVASAK